MLELRAWQKDGINKVNKAFESKNHEMISLAASVGAGKTLLAAYAFGKFILDNMFNSTLQIFVAPRIDLCEQQSGEIEHVLFEYFHLKNNTHYKIISINCRHGKTEFNRKNLENLHGHFILLFCDESLWGSEQISKNLKISRYNSYESQFIKMEKEGFKFGTIFYDEAHNYNNQVNKKIITDMELIK